MNILLIPDKFKGSLTAEEVIQSLTSGIHRAVPNAMITATMASDGGDGFLDAVAHYSNVEEVICDTVDPLGRSLRTPYVLHRETGEAYIELAKTAGLVLLNDSEKDPLNTSTLGLGIQLRNAIDEGTKTIYVGLGGSATNDGGIGIAAALGYKFLDVAGNELHPCGGNLSKINSIDSSKAAPVLKGISIFAVNDVSNPLFGENGAAYVYAAQKGADTDEMVLLDTGLQHLDSQVRHHLNKNYAIIPGAGAAGGAAYGLKTFTDAEFLSGIDFILGLAGIKKLLARRRMDYIITGEGKIDSQTLSGKLVSGILKLGREHNISVIAVCGTLDTNEDDLRKQGLHHVIEVKDSSKPLKYNMENAAKLVENAIYNFLVLKGI